MNSDDQYKPQAIPPRGQKQTFPKLVNTKSAFVDLINAAKFAEIEYETGRSIEFGHGANPPIANVLSQPIGKKEADPIKDKFLEMRRIFYDNPYSNNDSRLFYHQAKFMEDFQDDYPGYEDFSMYYPNYQHMGYEQLRTYFTWRTQARQGQHTPINLSYIFVHIYELLANIGVQTPAQGLEKLLALWKALRNHAPALDKYLPSWLKDYHIYYGLPFVDFVREHDLVSHYPEIYLYEAGADMCLELWSGISKYDITKSNFYNGGNEALMRDCFYAVVEAVKAFCISRKTRLEELLAQETYRLLQWRPFTQALFHPWNNQPDRKVELNNQEKYYCVNNHWMADITLPHTNRGDIAGYIIKKTEECLRKAVKHNRQIKAYTKSVSRSFRGLKKLGFTRATLDKVIEKAVLEYHQSTKRTVVVVDTGNLERIRKEALGTQDLLALPEDVVEAMKVGEGSDANTSVDTPEPLPKINTEPQPSDSLEGWSALKSNLTPTEAEALRIILKDSAGLKSHADANNIMQEVLIDSINEKANDHIGDNIIDDNFEIYEDYVQQATETIM